jgi:hypothetical protein
MGFHAPYESFCIQPMQNLEEGRNKGRCVSKGVYSVILKCFAHL